VSVAIVAMIDRSGDKRDMAEPTDLFVVLPYLWMRHPVEPFPPGSPLPPQRVPIRGIECRSNRDVEGLSDTARTHLEAITRLFYFTNGEPITEMVCAVIPAQKRKGVEGETVRRVRQEAHLLIAYLYTAPQPTGGVAFPYELSSIYLFEPSPVPPILAFHRPRERTKDDREEHENALRYVDGYQVFKDWCILFHVTSESQLQPDIPILGRNDRQDLAVNMEMFMTRRENWPLLDLLRSQSSVSGEIRERVFLAIQWYVRSCRETISAEEAFLNLAIAFESLLRLESGPKLTERFQDAILTLLGPVPRLDVWISQFYDARSDTVHEGKPQSLTLLLRPQKAAKSQKSDSEDAIPHGQLRDYGLRIFRLCLTSILTGATLAEAARLASSFVHNQERLENLCRVLSDSSLSPQERLNQIQRDVEDLRELPGDVFALQAGVKLKTLLGVAKRLLGTYRELSPPLTPETKRLLDSAIDAPPDDEHLKLQQLQDLMRSMGNEPMGDDWLARSNRLLITTFLQYAADPAFRIRLLPGMLKKT
jgi:hypothetical protein